MSDKLLKLLRTLEPVAEAASAWVMELALPIAVLVACVTANSCSEWRHRALKAEQEIENMSGCEVELQDALERLLVFYAKEFKEDPPRWVEAKDWSK